MKDNYYGWDHPWTARLYEQFNDNHHRYLEANEALVQQASLEPGLRALDFAAGTGRTAEAALPYLGQADHILCVEPAAAMREMGKRRLPGDRINWQSKLPTRGSFDRILCGAAIWQLDSLEAGLQELVRLLSPGGALCFNIPALYLGQSEEPGGGEDPLLLALPAQLYSDAPPPTLEPPQVMLNAAQIESLLAAAGLRPESWSFRLKLTQAAYRDWLKIPPLTNRLMPGFDPQHRVQLIDDAYQFVPRDSWRWERWLGWTAWKDSI